MVGSTPTLTIKARSESIHRRATCRYPGLCERFGGIGSFRRCRSRGGVQGSWFTDDNPRGSGRHRDIGTRVVGEEAVEDGHVSVHPQTSEYKPILVDPKRRGQSPLDVVTPVLREIA